MINLCVEEYCHGCPEFEAYVRKTMHEDFYGQLIDCSTFISCANLSKCRAIYDHLIVKANKKELNHDQN